MRSWRINCDTIVRNMDHLWADVRRNFLKATLCFIGESLWVAKSTSASNYTEKSS